LSRSVTYFEHLATADFETPVKREICLTDRPASSKRDMISFRCCNASCWNDETLRQPERRRMGQRTVPCPTVLSHCHELEARAEALDPDELETARLSLRPEEEKRAVSKAEDAYGESYDYATMREAKDRV